MAQQHGGLISKQTSASPPSSVVSISPRVLGLLVLALAITLTMSLALTSVLVMRTARTNHHGESTQQSGWPPVDAQGAHGGGQVHATGSYMHAGGVQASSSSVSFANATTTMTVNSIDSRSGIDASSGGASTTSIVQDESGVRAPLLVLLFITRGDMPFSSVWRRFLDGCPSSSVSVVVHSQNPRYYAYRYKQMNATLVADPDLENPWHKYSMVEIEMRLWEAGLKALNSRPGWLHLADEHSVPLCNCACVFDHLLQGGAGTSYLLDSHYGVQADDDEWATMLSAKKSDPKWSSKQHPFKTSQWSTLWHEHAAWLVQNRDMIRERWKDVRFEPGRRWKFKANQYAAADEVVVSTELLSRGVVDDFGRSLTHVSWDASIGGPMVHNAAGLRCLALWARKTGQLFLRKVHKGGYIVDAAINNINDGGRCPAAIERLAPKYELGEPPGRMSVVLQSALGAGCDHQNACDNSLFTTTMNALQIVMHCPTDIGHLPLQQYLAHACQSGHHECVRRMLGQDRACSAVATGR